MFMTFDSEFLIILRSQKLQRLLQAAGTAARGHSPAGLNKTATIAHCNRMQTTPIAT